MVKKEKDPIKDFIEDVWPKTKKELEKASDNAKKMLSRGEVYLREVSEKGIEKTKKISLSLKKEKLYYDLGKSVASTSLSTIKTNKKIGTILRQIKSLETQIKKIK